MENKPHKAGFVNIVGKPNVGKSTLMNAMVGEKVSIITSKAQTTRHRIMGILSGENFQVVYSDTPGIIEPKYALHKAMMKQVYFSYEDADIVLFVVDINEKVDEEEFEEIIKRVTGLSVPIFVIINKADLATEYKIKDAINFWTGLVHPKEIIPVSALEKYNVEKVFQLIIDYLPEHPAYFDKDQLTDKTERFIASEIIREKIFLNYDKEVPYSTEVVITDFQDEKDIIRMRAQIIVERDSQKGIIIGKGGEMLKKIGTEARKDMEAFFGKKVFLEQHVKVEQDWRNKENKLRNFGYTD